VGIAASILGDETVCCLGEHGQSGSSMGTIFLYTEEERCATKTGSSSSDDSSGNFAFSPRK
jgi:hypothetical protein